MTTGSKHHVASPEVFTDCGYAAGNINTIPDSMLDSIADGLILNRTVLLVASRTRGGS